MPKKVENLFVCSHCDAQYQKWIGRCLECSKWGTIEEIVPQQTIHNPAAATSGTPAPLTALSSVHKTIETELPRYTTNSTELDRVLGGGIMQGSLILIGGEPGVGKSTLTLQVAAAIPKTIIFSGEESVSQLTGRATRLSLNLTDIQASNTTHVESIIATIHAEKPNLVIIDSIQTIYSDETTSESGGMSQIKICTTKLLAAAKSTNTSIIIIGQITKGGDIAGPKTLEHLVDTVLYLEGESHHSYRILRSAKNRFGPTDEIGIFLMEEGGLYDVENPATIFLEERDPETSGSVITCLLEGSRPVLIEVQALVTPTVFGYPVRKSSGFDLNRLHVLAAVLQKYTGMQLANYDIHINIVGGIKAKEPAVDLAVCMAIASSYKEKVLSPDLVVFGEVGLGGEVRTASQSSRRIKECQRLGKEKIITAKRALTNSKKDPKNKLIGVQNITELISHT